MSTTGDMRTEEPTKFTAGFSETWRKTLPKFSTATHALKYVLRRMDGGSGSVTITAATDGPSTWTATFSPASTGNLEPGLYRLTGYIEDDATVGQQLREIVFSSPVNVLADPSKADGDSRSFARRMVDRLRTTLEKLATGTITSATVNGKTYNRASLGEMRAELSRFEEIVAREEGRGGHQIKARFRATSR